MSGRVGAAPARYPAPRRGARRERRRGDWASSRRKTHTAPETPAYRMRGTCPPWPWASRGPREPFVAEPPGELGAQFGQTQDHRLSGFIHGARRRRAFDLVRLLAVLHFPEPRLLDERHEERLQDAML